MALEIVTSVAPYVTAANAYEAIKLAHYDGFAGIELNEDHLHQLIRRRPHAYSLIQSFSSEHNMTNSIHKTLHRPSIDSGNKNERKRAVNYTLATLDIMEKAGLPRIVLHSFADLPEFLALKNERANSTGYYVGCRVIKCYGLLAPALKLHRKMRSNSLTKNFMQSLSEIARYAADKRVDRKPIEVVVEEHYSDYIDYDSIPYGTGKFTNVIRGIDTAHRLIRTQSNVDLSDTHEQIHLHAVDTDGRIDDHRTIGTGKVRFENVLENAISRKLTETVVLEDGDRKSALSSKDAIAAKILKSERVFSNTV